MKKLKILLVDDDQMVREGLRLLIERQPDLRVVGEAGDGKTALATARRVKPDILIVDTAMPDAGGMRSANSLREECRPARVIGLVSRPDETGLREWCNAGLAGYLLKRASGDALVRAVRLVAGGGVYYDPAVAFRALMPLPGVNRSAEPRATHLSVREREVLTLLAWGHTNKEIATSLSISIKTVETYRVRLSQKLRLHSRTGMVQYALSRGWMGGTGSEPRTDASAGASARPGLGFVRDKPDSPGLIP